MNNLKLRVLSLCLLLVTASPTLTPSQTPRRRATPRTTAEVTGPTIWRDPGRVRRLDFAGGPGGAASTPVPPFKFIEEDTSGSNPKVKVRDAAGRVWGVKWGSEVNAEVFASRLIWAAGYWVEPSYFVGSGKIEGATRLKRAKDRIGPDGAFTDARFELREEGIKKLKDEESWRWDRNPFVGTRELNGLRILVMLTSNWDSKDQRDANRGSNTAIFKNERTGQDRYLITDWGASMGKWGGYFTREKWDCKGFADQTKDFVKGAKNGAVEFGYSGQRTSDVREGISVADVRWLIQYVGRISNAQVRAGLKAAGATPEEVECFTAALRDRINQLKAAAR